MLYNKSMTHFMAFTGKLVVVGKQPDGDSIRFVADSPALFSQLDFGYRVRLSKDGSVQLRFEVIDAPETHYEGQSQLLGLPARNALLRQAGFTKVAFTDDATVATATPLSVPATILAKMVEINGRPVAYVFAPMTLPLADGAVVADPSLFFAKSLNMHMLNSGAAYLTLYTSTPQTHRAFFVQHAKVARSSRLGVWAQDATASFRLVNQASIGPNGELILPKLFRRCTDYLRAQHAGFTGTLAQWLVSTMQPNDVGENDMLWVGAKRHSLSELVVQPSAHTIGLNVDILDLVFIEK